MPAYQVALQITLIAFGALIIISLFFILLTRILRQVARIGAREEVKEKDEEERKRVAIATAAVMSYLEGGPASIRVVKKEGGSRSAWKAAVDNRFREAIGWRGKIAKNWFPSRERPTRGLKPLLN